MRRKDLYILITITAFLLISCNETVDRISLEQLSQNNLKKESSPYLLQHAGNPVNWQPWNDAVLETAQENEKPLIISVGYSACHWCHVMEEESFEDNEVASYMNDHFISIKVDREERPDVDQVYMKALELATGNGGWPLNVIALPDGRPVWLGTYLNKSEWIEILKTTKKTIVEEPQKTEEYAAKIQNGISNTQPIAQIKGKARFRKDEVQSAVNRWRAYLDFKNGGMTQKEKFMMPTSQEYLLRYSYKNNDQELQEYINTTLNKMTHGGIYDPIDGGFSRYAIDSLWHIPHFEKMLYDNAQLISLYSNAYKVTQNENYKNVAEETIAFITGNLTHEKGLYSSSLDADSKNNQGHKEEGAYYSWSKKDLKNILADDFELFQTLYNINETGYWEKEQYVLIQTLTDDEVARKFNLKTSDLLVKKDLMLLKLKEAKSLREKPRVDDKVLASWNALTIIGFLNAYEATANKVYLENAKETAKAMQDKFLVEDSRLYHSYKKGKNSINGHLIDYATFINALIKLYENTGNTVYLTKANQLTEIVLSDFINIESPLFYYTSNKDKSLILKNTEVIDGVIPSSNAVMAQNLFLLSHYLGNKKYNDRAKNMLQVVKEDVLISGAGYSKWLNLMNNYSDAFYEIAVVGKDAKMLVKELQQHYLPNALIAQSNSSSEDYLLKNRFSEGETLIYVCRNNTCKLPVKTVEEALKLIK